MGIPITAGSQCVIIRDIVINGNVAFKKGEAVLVETISPNPQRPDYKYVVLSKSLNKRFQLSDDDLIVLPAQSIPTGATVPAVPQGVPYKRSTSSRKRTAITFTIIGVVVVVAVVFALIFFVFRGGISDSEIKQNYKEFVETTDDNISELMEIVWELGDKSLAPPEQLEAYYEKNPSASLNDYFIQEMGVDKDIEEIEELVKKTEDYFDTYYESTLEPEPSSAELKSTKKQLEDFVSNAREIVDNSNTFASKFFTGPAEDVMNSIMLLVDLQSTHFSLNSELESELGP